MMPALLDAAVRAALVAGTTACVLRAARIEAASVKHAAWTGVMMVMLLLPLWVMVGPRIRIAVLPAATGVVFWSAAPIVAAPPQGIVPDEPRSIAAASQVALFGGVLGALAVIYAVGGVILLARLAIGTRRAHSARRTATRSPGQLTSRHCVTPITLGWVWPVVLLPDGWVRWPASQLDAVLMHEREHARRRDPLIQWLALLNRAVFWFHPLAWWLERQLASLAEQACDASVIRSGHSPQSYSECLMTMARLLRRHGRRIHLVGTAMPGTGLAERVRYILEGVAMKPETRTRAVSTLIFCTLTSALWAASVPVPRRLIENESAAVEGTPVTTAVATVAVDRHEPAHKTMAARATRTASRANTDGSAVARARPSETAPDFSGAWVLVSSTFAGVGRGGGDGRLVSIVSGAPVNCGTACRIQQDGGALTISRTEPVSGAVPPDNGRVLLNLSGNDSTITQENGGQYTAKATWNGTTLEVTRRLFSYDVTQTMSIESGKLLVLTAFGGHEPVTLTYVRR